MTSKRHPLATKPASAGVDRVIHQEHSQYAGPIPPPDLLAQFNRIDPTFADRIVAMAEKSLASQVETARSSHTQVMSGLVVSAALAVSGMVTTVIIAVVAPSWGAFVPAILGVVPGTISAVGSLLSLRKS